MTGYKAEHELEVFRKFAKAIGMQFDPSSITQPDPPDIVVDSDGIKRGYELVEMVESAHEVTMKRFDFQEKLRDEFLKLPLSDRKNLAKFLITLDVYSEVTKNKFNGNIQSFIKVLCGCELEAGKFEVPDKFSRFFKEVSLTRVSVPNVDCSPFLVIDCQMTYPIDGGCVKAITSKFAPNRYDRVGVIQPSDLLIYRGDKTCPFEFAVSLLTMHCKYDQLVEGSCFDRVWLFDCVGDMEYRLLWERG